MMDLSQLAAEFPRADIHWRAQTLTRNGDKALALAYLDARDVMDRLDEVCGPAGWQSRYTETAKGRVLCQIGIRIGDEWVWKSDGAGDTAVEGDKGGISDAFKRAAVHWGIGRYLYRLDAVWCPCETYERNGKKHWFKWTSDPWQFVRTKAKPETEKEPERDPRKIADTLIRLVRDCQSYDQITKAISGAKFDEAWRWLGEQKPAMSNEVKAAVNDMRNKFDPSMQAPDDRSAA